jgi:hypothetical protein
MLLVSGMLRPPPRLRTLIVESVRSWKERARMYVGLSLWPGGGRFVYWGSQRRALADVRALAMASGEGGRVDGREELGWAVLAGEGGCYTGGDGEIQVVCAALFQGNGRSARFAGRKSLRCSQRSVQLCQSRGGGQVRQGRFRRGAQWRCGACRTVWTLFHERVQ